MPHSSRLLRWCLAGFLASPLGCVNFFRELGSEDEQEDESEDEPEDQDSEESGEGPCEFPQDDSCRDQDRLTHCDPNTHAATQYDCSVLCGANLNVSCIMTETGAHGCWCIEPGQYKNATCSDLEACLLECAAAPSDACNDACFARTDGSTARVYGVLVSCAYNQCHELCVDAPDDCSGCIQAGLRGGGECGLARAVCDADRSTDPSTIWD